MKFASRLQSQQSVHWATVRQLITKKEAEGVKVIQLSSGNPDAPTPPHIVAALRESAQEPTFHRYPFSFQTSLHEAIAGWYQRRFGVELDATNEIITASGSQMLIGNLGLAILNNGDISLVPNPAYNSYGRATLFAGGEVFELPLNAGNHYLPNLQAIPPEICAKTRLLWLNYPNNPTGAIAPLSFFEEVVAFAKTHNIIVCHDNAYSEITYDGYQATSFLAVPGAKEVGLELNTLSKAYNMAGWRVGMAAGNSKIIQALTKVGHNFSMGLFGPVQMAAVAALSEDQNWLAERNAIYQERRDIVVAGLKAAGLEPENPKATLYVWAKMPASYPHNSLAFSKMVLEQTAVWLSSGVFFGTGGERYIRATLTMPASELREAMRRLQGLKW